EVVAMRRAVPAVHFEPHAPVLSYAERTQRSEELLLDSFQLVSEIVGLRSLRQRQRASGILGEQVKAALGEAHPEEPRSDIFDLMGLIEDHRVIIRDDAARVRAPQSQVCKEQVMVDDDQRSLLRLSLHAGDETGVVVAALR